MGKGTPPEHSRVKPGTVLNPWGRKGKDGTGGFSIKRALRRMLADADVTIEDILNENQHRKMKVGDAVALTLLAKALKGDVTALKEVLDRTDGKESQAVSLKAEIKDAISKEQRDAAIKAALSNGMVPHSIVDTNAD